MRKRHAARPLLEPVEDRLVLSVVSPLGHTPQAHSAVAGHIVQHPHPSPARATHARTHVGKSHSATARHHAAGTAHHAVHHSTSSSLFSKLSDSFSNFLKSVGL